MDFKSFENLIKSSRTTRRFKKDIKVDKNELKELVNLARMTSSAMNAQPLKYILVTKKEQVEELSKTAQWAAHLYNWSQSENERPSAYIIMLNDKNIGGFHMFDAGASFEAISLGAKVKGYSVCPLASINKSVCKKLFDFPSNLEIIIGIAIGVGSENIKLVETSNGNTSYYRLEDQTHCVSKRSLENIVICE
jgi:nitroreductase